MLFSCKCLNFIATTADKYCSAAGDNNSESQLISVLINAFLQKYSRNFQFYSPCMEFFKQTFGPIHDFTITTINQNDLIYQLPLITTINDNSGGSKHIWQINICINCNTALCAKRLTTSTTTAAAADNKSSQQQSDSIGDYLINANLLTNNDELSQRKLEKSFSDTFGIIIYDHPTVDSNYSSSIGTTAMDDNQIVDNNRQPMMLSFNANKQNRIKRLTQNMQSRLQKEIADTDERIQRFSEQQFALLKSFREKSEQEYQILLKIINQVPEPLPETMMTTMMMTTTTTNSSSSNNSNNDFIMIGGHRRSILTNNGDGGINRRSLGAVTTLDISTPTTPSTTTNATLPSNSSISAIENAQNREQHQQQQAFIFNNNNNRKTANFDTPPATPENIPMSVGNSPTFRQQQQQQQQISSSSSSSFYQQQQQQISASNIDSVDDCFFELEGVENYQLTECEVNESLEDNRNNISDFGGDSDDAEEAEDALSLDTSGPIPFARIIDNRYQQRTTPQFGKSLPITIDNPSMMAQRTDVTNSNDDLIDDNVDIAASIKALAKSVHGEAVFGDLPKPRLRSQE